MSTNVSRGMAETVLAEVADMFAHDPHYAPTLHEPGFHADGWVIAWEYGPENWVHAVGERLRATRPQRLIRYGLRTEALNHWSISVYRD